MITEKNIRNHIDVVFDKIDVDIDIKFFDKDILLSFLREETIAKVLNNFVFAYLNGKFDFEKNEKSVFKKFRLQYFGFMYGLKMIYSDGKKYIEIFTISIDQILETFNKK